jgi:hypothetical protein
LLKPKWLNDLHEAFMLRQGEEGLSVSFDCTPEECIEISGMNTSHGVASLGVAGILGVGLTVVADEVHHANIFGVPHKDVDAARAEWCASRLAEIATIVDRIKRIRPTT